MSPSFMSLSPYQTFNKEAAYAQQVEIDAAEQAAMDASKETFQPADDIDTANP